MANLFAGAGQNRGAAAGPPVVRGPFYSGTIMPPVGDEPIAAKGIVVTLNWEKNVHVVYDTDLLRFALAWSGRYLSFGNTQTQISWPPPARAQVTPAFVTRPAPGWAKAGSFVDPRKERQGSLPKDWAHYEGLYVNGSRVILKYRVGSTEVLETPGLEIVTNRVTTAEGQEQPTDQLVYTRTFQFDKDANGEALILADAAEANAASSPFAGSAGPSIVPIVDGSKLIIAGAGLPPGSRIETTAAGQVVLRLGPVQANRPFRIGISESANASGFAAFRNSNLTDLRTLIQGGPTQWTDPVVTQGVLGTENEAYVVDTITEPFTNSYNAKTFYGGFDFFPDGRAAICTFHGEVWIVSGINDTLERLTWKRYATGLFQGLGLKIVEGKIYVLGRDQITILHDLNNDGEADYYQNFNNDIIVTANYHEFALDLHTDRAGNFYFAKGAPWEPVVTSPNQGGLFRVSKDGSKLEMIATGLRAPNGMTIGPNDEITVSDNQGHWMPASKLNWIEPGGFYGMVPSAQRDLTFERSGTNFVANPSRPDDRTRFDLVTWNPGREPFVPIPAEGFNKPISWLPMSMDNSSGGQTWVTSDRWGPLQNHLLFLSYGKCTLFEVMLDRVDGVRQAAMVQFPFRFNTGVMRARFNPRDGQLYASGLRGWQTSATRDGGFYRVRYTGQPVRMATEFHAAKTGVEITFASPLQPATATDPGNYAVERWNYRWTGAYGSPEFSVDNPDQQMHDRLEVKSARLSADNKKIFLEIEGMKPADQVRVRFSIAAADGAPVAQDIYATVYKLGEPSAGR